MAKFIVTQDLWDYLELNNITLWQYSEYDIPKSFYPKVGDALRFRNTTFFELPIDGDVKFKIGGDYNYFLATNGNTYAVDLSYNNDKSIYMSSFDDHADPSTYKLFLTLIKPEPEPEPEPKFDVEITQADLNQMFSKNFDGFVNGVELVLGSKLNYPFVVEYRTKTGYAFVTISSPYGAYDPVEGEYASNYGVLSANGTIATMTYKKDGNDIYKFGSLSQYNITTKAYTAPIVYDLVINTAFINYHVSRNTDVNINGVNVVEGTGLKYPMLVKVNAKNGFIFKIAYSEYNPTIGDFIAWELSADGKTQFRNFNAGYDYTDYDIKPVAVVEPIPKPDLIIDKVFIDDLVSKRITAKINGVLVDVGDEFNYPYSVEMVVIPQLYFTRYFGGYVIVTGSTNRFNISPDKKTLTKTFINDRDKLQDYSFETDIDESVLEPEKFAYIDVFVVDTKQARELATTQYTFWKYTGMDSPDEAVPQGDNVISFIDLPFNIPVDLQIGSKPIEIGSIPTYITAPYLNIDLYAYNMGDITIPDDKNNFLSFENTTVVLHLPYTNPINLDIDYVIGQTISIVYNISLYTGIASVNISSTKINGVIDTKSIKMNIDIPFGKPDDNPSANSPRNIDFGIDNGVLIPYIEILRYDAILENGFFTVPVPDETLLIEQSGFIKIDEIDLKVKASKDEKEMILTAINQGVIIK